MEDTPAKATHEGTIEVGNAKIRCAVLEDGTRLLTEADFLGAIGRANRYGGPRGEVTKLPPFLSAKNLKTFITDELRCSSTPVRFRPKKGGGLRGISYGYRAELLPQVCNVFLEARKVGELNKTQEHIAQQCEVLVRGLATVGIIALVDEATGYQDARVKNALAKILEEFLAKERRPYIGTFPTEFYREIFRLNNWPWHEDSTKRPGVIAHWTNDLVYERLAPGVLDELKKRNPTYKTGQRRHKLFQFLSEEVGEPKLKSHFDGVMALARAAPNMRRFKEMVNRAYPKKWDQLKLDIDGGDGGE